MPNKTRLYGIRECFVNGEQAWHITRDGTDTGTVHMVRRNAEHLVELFNNSTSSQLRALGLSLPRKQKYRWACR